MQRADTLYVHTDASVRGETWVMEPGARFARRSKYGPAMGAWIGWHGASTSGRPTIAGQSYLGRHGVQGAEYQAATAGLNAALLYVRSAPLPPAVVILRVDNLTVYEQLRGSWGVEQMRPYYERAVAGVQLLRAEGCTIQVQKVSREHALHRYADRMADQAWDQVLFQPSWRPKRPSKAAKPRPDAR